VKKARPKASIFKGSRVVCNIHGNDYRLIAVVQYAADLAAAIARDRCVTAHHCRPIDEESVLHARSRA
jgi:mRNA-degrading endonuclease HigB of HigAB toxin-antitoxin module